jgi:hypothetical protein
MASDVAATSGKLANYTKTEEKHNAKVNSQSVPTSGELLRRESRPVAFVVGGARLLLAHVLVLARPIKM